VILIRLHKAFIYTITSLLSHWLSKVGTQIFVSPQIANPQIA
jgi:hypothetical protein